MLRKKRAHLRTGRWKLRSNRHLWGSRLRRKLLHLKCNWVARWASDLRLRNRFIILGSLSKQLEKSKQLIDPWLPREEQIKRPHHHQSHLIEWLIHSYRISSRCTWHLNSYNKCQTSCQSSLTKWHHQEVSHPNNRLNYSTCSKRKLSENVGSPLPRDPRIPNTISSANPIPNIWIRYNKIKDSLKCNRLDSHKWFRVLSSTLDRTIFHNLFVSPQRRGSSSPTEFPKLAQSTLLLTKTWIKSSMKWWTKTLKTCSNSTLHKSQENKLKCITCRKRRLCNQSMKKTLTDLSTKRLRRLLRLRMLLGWYRKKLTELLDQYLASNRGTIRIK